MECKVKDNRKTCNCSYPGCDKKGLCCECIAYHRRLGELPACYFPDNVEKTYDRSIARFVALHRQASIEGSTRRN
ncbi:MAG: hypothetical protein JW759_01840 [Candidatus Coatesbacteria bacterium]|nr:hypothetical protein [Candidatus Coatesbacteria bacterium]